MLKLSGKSVSFEAFERNGQLVIEVTAHNKRVRVELRGTDLDRFKGVVEECVKVSGRLTFG